MSSPSTTTNSTVTAVISTASTKSEAGVFQISEELKEISTNTATAVIETATEEMNPSGENSDQIESTGENFGNLAATTDETEISCEIVTSLTKNVVIALVPQKYQDITASVTNLGFGLANAYLLPVISDAFGVAINPLKLIDMNSLALTQIKNKLESMDKKLDTLLNTEMEVAIDYMDRGLSNLAKIEKANQADVKAKATDAAIEAFSHANMNAITGYKKVSTFKHKVLCKSVIIFSSIMKTLYDESTKTFLTFQTANEELKSLIAENVYDEVKKLIDQDFSTIKIPRLTWDKKGKKEEYQNTLDSLLKPCLPLMWYYIDLFQGYNNFLEENEELLKFIPAGLEDAAKIVMKNGNFFQIWKEIEDGGKDFYLNSDTCLPCQSCPTKGDCSTIEVILDGDVKKEFDFLSGKYKKKTNLYNGKCIWAQIANRKISVYYCDLEYWGFCPGQIRTVQYVPCPTVANIFEYYQEGTGEWKPAPINSVIIKCAE